MSRLPVSGLQVAFRQLTGLEDLLLQERQDTSVTLSLMLIDRLAHVTDGALVDWGELTVTDLDALLLLLRQAVLGDVIRADTQCSQPSCRARVDISFRVGDYLASQKGRSPRWVEKADEAGWFRLTSEAAMFRLPTGSDLAVMEHEVRPERELIRKCTQPAEVSSRLRQRIERAMETLAPSLSRTMTGQCPECRAEMRIYFDVRPFVLRELRDHAHSVYQDVHLLALHYKWPEENILALPQKRRRHYAAMLRSQGVA